MMDQMTWKEFFQRNVDKLLLLVVLHGMMLLMISEMSNPTFLDWIKGEVGTVLGALLMLITGRASHPEPTVSSTTTTAVTVPIPDPKAAAGAAPEVTK